MMTSREFAQRIGVSQSTVSRAINDHPSVSEKTREYVRHMAAEYGFVLNSQARSLKTSKTGTVGVLFPLYFDSMSKNLMVTHIYDELQKELARWSCDILMIHDQAASNSAFERIVRSGKVDGLINLRAQLLPEKVRLAQASGMPFVSLHSAHQDNPQLHQLVIDEEDAGRQVGEYMAQFEGERYVHISIDDDTLCPERRLAGFEAGLRQGGRALDDILRCPLSMEAARELVLAHAPLFTSGRTSIFVYNDLMALGVVNALELLGVPIPERAQIVSMDDIPLASWGQPRLTTMHAPVRQMVEDGCQRLMALMNGAQIPPEMIRYRASMVRRDTTRQTIT